MKVSVIGQGYVGLSLSVELARNNIQVVGFDINIQKVSDLIIGNHELPSTTKDELLQLQKQSLKITSEPKDIYGSKIVVIAVPTPLNEKRLPDLSNLYAACDLINRYGSENILVINESTSYPGTLRKIIAPQIKITNKFVVAPERIDPGNQKWNLKNTPRIIGGLSNEACESAKQFYEIFCKNVITVKSPEIAEAAKLLENSYRQINIAFVNEVAQILEKFEISAHDTIAAAATKPFGFSPFVPGVGVGGHCIPVDPNYLSYAAEQLGINANFIKLAEKTNIEMPMYLAKRFQKDLGGSLVDKNIQIVGLSYKTEIADLRESPAIALINELRRLGAVVTWHDPIVKKWNGEQSCELNLKVDLGVIVTPHRSINFEPWQLGNVRVVDVSATSQEYGWTKYL